MNTAGNDGFNAGGIICASPSSEFVYAYLKKYNIKGKTSLMQYSASKIS